jgi:Fanconi anemia group M protein
VRQLSILAETLSAGSPVAQQLIERGVQVQAANLAAGTYLVTGTCAILHVPVAEFSRWITDKTIFRRITEFKRAVKEPILIIEGAEDREARTVSPSALRAALAFVTVHNRVPVLFAADPRESADLIYAMVNQTQNGMGLTLDSTSPVSQRSEPETVEADAGDDVHAPGNGHGNGNGNGSTPDNLVELPEQIVRMIPEIGPVTARALLKRFGSLRSVFAASAQELTKIDGIGPKRAKKIASFLSRRETR